jgi:protein involved in polysaccharide export with SLBB domain
MKRFAQAYWSVAALSLLLVAGVARAEDYVLGVEDEVSISVWMHPELDRKVAIGTSGSIVFPPVGDIRAAGLTTKQLGDRLGDRLSSYLRSTSTVTVTISKYLSRSVIVSGAVFAPGRYGFETIPNLLDVLNAAGGPVPGADPTGSRSSARKAWAGARRWWTCWPRSEPAPPTACRRSIRATRSCCSRSRARTRRRQATDLR